MQEICAYLLQRNCSVYLYRQSAAIRVPDEKTEQKRLSVFLCEGNDGRIADSSFCMETGDTDTGSDAPKEKRCRGYNQAELLAEEISRLTGIRAEKNVLRCTRMHSEQKMLSRKDRRKNLKGCFAVSEECQKQFARVLLVDDVYTTGSTLDEIADVLKRAGVKQIFFVVLCIGKGK